jgi:hypothetical protein
MLGQTILYQRINVVVFGHEIMSWRCVSSTYFCFDGMAMFSVSKSYSLNPGCFGLVAVAALLSPALELRTSTST